MTADCVYSPSQVHTIVICHKLVGNYLVMMLWLYRPSLGQSYLQEFANEAKRSNAWHLYVSC